MPGDGFVVCAVFGFVLLALLVCSGDAQGLSGVVYHAPTKAPYCPTVTVERRSNETLALIANAQDAAGFFKLRRIGGCATVGSISCAPWQTVEVHVPHCPAVRDLPERLVIVATGDYICPGEHNVSVPPPVLPEASTTESLAMFALVIAIVAILTHIAVTCVRIW